MRRSRWPLALVGGLALALGVSCNQGGEVVEGLQKIEEKACACEDQECAEASLDELVQFFKDHADAKGTEDNAQKAAEAMKGTFECASKAGASQEKVMEAQGEIAKISQE